MIEAPARRRQHMNLRSPAAGELQGQLQVGFVLAGRVGLDLGAGASGPVQRVRAGAVEVAHHGVDGQARGPGRFQPAVGRNHQIVPRQLNESRGRVGGDHQGPWPLHGRYGVGSLAMPSTRNSKCRCGPVDQPVEPMAPM